MEADYAEFERKKEESDAVKKTNDETNAPLINAVVVAEVVDTAPSATGDDLATFNPGPAAGIDANGTSGQATAAVVSGPAQ